MLVASPRKRSPRSKFHQTPELLSLVFGEVMEPGDLDRQLERSLRSEREPSDILIDLSACKYIEIAELPSMIALFQSRRERRKRTRLRLPRSRETRDFLKVWGFYAALSSSVGQPVEDLVSGADHHLLREGVTSYHPGSTSLNALELRWLPDVNRPEEKRNFFGFMTHYLQPKQLELSEEKALVPLNEARRWQEPLIKAVLGNHLRVRSGEEDEVARVVIYESLANAVQHPNATIIQVVSRFQKSSIDSEAGHFTICVWDDGESMITTLAKAIKKVGRVRSAAFPSPMYEKLSVILKDPSGVKLKPDCVIDQGGEIDLNASEDTFLLACLFPGITRRVAEDVPDVVRLGPASADGPLNTMFGMGLYVLTRTVVDRYGGELSFRSGRHFLNLKAAHDSVRVHNNTRYIASITQYSNSLAGFKGNLAIIRIPHR